MRKPNINATAEGPVVVQPQEPRTVVRTGEFVAKAVALIGGASLVIGGALGYALGYLDGGRDREDRP
jgi:hypothetical protein